MAKFVVRAIYIFGEAPFQDRGAGEIPPALPSGQACKKEGELKKRRIEKEFSVFHI